MTMPSDTEPPVRARIPADLDTPDPVFAGLSMRQVTVVAVFAVPVYVAWKTLLGQVSGPVLLTFTVPVLAAGVAVALARRDGISLDRWLVAALAHRLSPRRLSLALDLTPPPASGKSTARQMFSGAPVAAITEDGVIVHPDGRHVAVLAVTTIPNALSTNTDDAVLAAGTARWLNGLSGPVQILLQNRPTDLAAHAVGIGEQALALPHPDLAGIALDHAEFLLDIHESDRPLQRQALIVCSGGAASGAENLFAVLTRKRRTRTRHSTEPTRGRRTAPAAGPRVSARAAAEAITRALRTATDIESLGVRAHLLDGAQVRALLHRTWNPIALDDDENRPEHESWQESQVDLPVGLLEAGPDHVHRTSPWSGPLWSASVAVTGYPDEVGMAWIEPLTSWPGVIDVALHVSPMSAPAAASRIRRRRIRAESARRLAADRGSLDDPLLEAVTQDAGDLADKIARGASRLFTTTLTVTVHAPTRTALGAAVADLRAHAASLLLETHVMTWRQREGWISSLPIGAGSTAAQRIMDTDALAAACPLAAPDVPASLPCDTGGRDIGVLTGLNLVTGGVVTSDRWALDNHNQIVLARSGAGKSYAAKTTILRELYTGTRVCVIDPEREYLELARQIGGTVIELGAPGVRVNPMSLPAGDPDAFTRRCLALHSLIDVMLTETLDPTARTVLDRAIIATYARAGITADPATWQRPAPRLHDLVTAVGAGCEAGKDDESSRAAATLRDRLMPWVGGSFRGLFDAPGAVDTLDPQGEGGHLVVWSTRLLPEELRPVGMMLAVDAIWRSIDRQSSTGEDRPASELMVDDEEVRPTPRPVARQDRHPGVRPGTVRQLVVVDEASLLLAEPAGAAFLARLAKRSRKRTAGLVLITTDVADLLNTELGEVVLANCASVLLLRQAPQAIDRLVRACALSPGEAGFLLTARRGQGLLLAQARVPVDIVASPREHPIAAAPPDPITRPPAPSSAPSSARSSARQRAGRVGERG
ncbi:PrgI family protein [Kineosporia sp. J2-2]|uniref:PrgI family protein n=1 Tax=Kineosporia corallincola TaxID=2835133 RepID=A0ABS5TPD9_9ACTN|nr:PrgI family protein [Kineosporia corallincola]MBT0772956.1 PrgI family protein [Kineosporia corallincola]